MSEKLGPGSFRLFLAFVVVLHHSTPLRLGPWAVGLFFCLSGFWITEMWTRKYSLLEKPYPEFLVSRWWRLAPVLFFSTLLSAFVIHSRLISGNIQVLHSVSWWLSQPLIACSTMFGRLLPPAWTLDIEMQFYIVAPLIAILLLLMPSTLRLIVLMSALGWWWLRESSGTVGELSHLDIWLGIFLLGMIASINHWRPGSKFALSTGLIVITIFAVTGIMPVTRSWSIYRGATAHPLTGHLAATLTVGTIILSCPFAIWTTGLPSSNRDRFFGDLSYSLYMFHWLPRSWYYAHVSGNSQPAEMVIPLAVNILTSFAGAVAILLLVDRPVQRLRARWLKTHRVAMRSPATGEPAPAVRVSPSTFTIAD